jgi:hypothetical protein
MKTTTHENLEIEDFTQWYPQLHKTHSGILGAEWDKDRKTLKVFYKDDAIELTIEELKNIQIPTILRFRKKILQIDIPNAIATSETEFQVETFNTETIRKAVKEKYPEFEEVLKQ